MSSYCVGGSPSICSPVLMVNNEAQRKYKSVVAPVDMSDASANALRTALSTGLINGNGATLLHALLRSAKGKCSLLTRTERASTATLRATARRPWTDWRSFLVANDFNHRRWSLRLEEGGPMEVISRA